MSGSTERADVQTLRAALDFYIRHHKPSKVMTDPAGEAHEALDSLAAALREAEEALAYEKLAHMCNLGDDEACAELARRFGKTHPLAAASTEGAE